jgi:NAD/NADP transhydrogenase alpha subunit
MLSAMKPGSVVVDLAAENGGNCVATVPGQLIEHKGVTVIGMPSVDLVFRTVSSLSRIYRSPFTTAYSIIDIVFEQYHQIPPFYGTRGEALRCRLEG